MSIREILPGSLLAFFALAAPVAFGATCQSQSRDEADLKATLARGEAFVAQSVNIGPDFLKCILTSVGNSGTPIYIAGVTVATLLDLSTAEIRSELTFENCRFEGGFWAKETNFYHDLNIISTSTFLAGSRPGSAGGDFDLTSANIQGNLRLQNAQLDSFEAFAIHISGTLRIADVQVNTIDISDAFIGGLFWSLGSNGANFANSVSADDLSFTHADIVRLDSKREPQDASLEFLRKVNSASLFNQFEHRLREAGDPSKADLVFLMLHRRERDGASLTFRWADWIDGYVFGYGRFAIWPLSWSAAFIVAGAIIFWRADEKGKVQAAEKQSSNPVPFSSFWYSLELFIPFVDLGVGKGWHPRSGPLSTYLRVHQFVGWILIPVAAGAITGLTK